MALRALIFDLDGTLADTDPLHFRSWRESLAPYGIEMDQEEYARRVSGRHNPEIIEDLLPHLGEDASVAFARTKEARFRELAPSLQPLPGVRELLRRARAEGLLLGLVTNAPRDNAAYMMRALEVEDAFDAVVLGEDAAAAKPDPAPYLETMAQLGVGADEAIAFEDSPSGVRSARRAGLSVVGLCTTQAAETLADLGASPCVRDFDAPALWEGPLAFLREEAEPGRHPSNGNAMAEAED